MADETKSNSPSGAKYRMRLVSKSLFVICVGILNFSCQTHIEQTRGHLVIIGGGERTEQIMSRILELAGGDSVCRFAGKDSRTGCVYDVTVRHYGNAAVKTPPAVWPVEPSQ